MVIIVVSIIVRIWMVVADAVRLRLLLVPPAQQHGQRTA
jgi:hypothetical protein